MEDRRISHLEDVGAVVSRTVVARVAGGEADLVVHHDVQRAARAVATGLREVEHFLVDALAGDGRVAVDNDRKDLGLALVAATDLACVNRAFDNRVDDLKVRRVEGQGQVAGAARGRDVGREAHVVLDVARRQVALLLAFEFGEEHRRRLAQRIDQHVQAAAVGHADHHFVDTHAAGDADRFIHGNDQRFAAFQRETLLADILGMQVALQRLGCGQPLQQALFLVGAVTGARADRLEALLQPALLGVVAHVHVFDANRAAVGLPQGTEDVAELGVLRRPLERPGIEGLVQVGVGKAVEGQFEFVNLRTRHPLERIEFSPARAEDAVGIDQLENRNLLFAIATGRLRRRAEPAILAEFGKSCDDRRVRHVAGNVTRHLGQAVEIVTPFGGNGSRVVEIVLVELFDEWCIATEKHRAVEKLIHRSHRHPP